MAWLVNFDTRRVTHTSLQGSDRLSCVEFQIVWLKMMEDTGEDILRQKPGIVSSFFKRLGQVWNEKLGCFLRERNDWLAYIWVNVLPTSWSGLGSIHSVKIHGETRYWRKRKRGPVRFYDQVEKTALKLSKRCFNTPVATHLKQNFIVTKFR